MGREIDWGNPKQTVAIRHGGCDRLAKPIRQRLRVHAVLPGQHARHPGSGRRPRPPLPWAAVTRLQSRRFSENCLRKTCRTTKLLEAIWTLVAVLRHITTPCPARRRACSGRRPEHKWQPRRRQCGLVFGLGAMMYELVVNRLPFMATSIMATLESIRHGLPRHNHHVDADGDRATVTGMGHPRRDHTRSEPV